MILSDPPPTQADLHFRVAGFPVRVHPFFWLIALLLGLNAFDGEPKGTLIAMVVVFVSIVVHELGHAFLQRKFGGRPHIVLHGFGGLAICGDCDRSPRSQILISLAGPVAGFLLAAATVMLIGLTAESMAFVPFWAIDEWVKNIDREQLRQLTGANLLVGEIVFHQYPSQIVNMLVRLLLWINIFWGLMNLLPVYPLDGGQIAREIMTLGPNAREGIVRSLQLSIGVAVVAAVFGLAVLESLFMAIMFGYLAYMSYQNLQAYTGRGPGVGWR
ncbi:MAG: site-2 protease family protein [Aeoliella sp.]